jgi:hypothetical protein
MPQFTGRFPDGLTPRPRRCQPARRAGCRQRERPRAEVVELVAAVSPALDEVCGFEDAQEGKEVTHSFPFSIYTAQGACGKPRVVAHNRGPQARTYGNGSSEMRVLSSTYTAGAWR